MSLVLKKGDAISMRCLLIQTEIRNIQVTSVVFSNINEKELCGIGHPSGLPSGKFAHKLFDMCSQKLSEKDASH